MGQIARQSVPADWLCICAICEIVAIGATALLAIREPSVLSIMKPAQAGSPCPPHRYL